VFGEVEALVTSVLDGYNVCIFAYGQTGSGKTFSMEVCVCVFWGEGASERVLRVCASLYRFMYLIDLLVYLIEYRFMHLIDLLVYLIEQR